MRCTSFLPFVFLDVGVWNAFHPVDLYLDVAPIGQRVGHFVDGVFVDLHTVDRQARARIQLLVTNVTFEMLGLLVLDQNLLVVKLTVAIPASDKNAVNMLFSIFT